MYTTAFLRQFGEAYAAANKLRDTVEEVFGTVSEVIFRGDDVIVTDESGVLQTFQMSAAFARLVENASDVKPRRPRKTAAAEPKSKDGTTPEGNPKSAAEVINSHQPPETGLGGPEPDDGGVGDPPDPEEPAVQVSESIRYHFTVEEQPDGVWRILEHIDGQKDPIYHGSENQLAVALRRAGEFRKKYDGDMNRLQTAPVATVPYDEEPPF